MIQACVCFLLLLAPFCVFTAGVFIVQTLRKLQNNKIKILKYLPDLVDVSVPVHIWNHASVTSKGVSVFQSWKTKLFRNWHLRFFLISVCVVLGAEGVTHDLKMNFRKHFTYLTKQAWTVKCWALSRCRSFPVVGICLFLLIPALSGSRSLYYFLMDFPKCVTH